MPAFPRIRAGQRLTTAVLGARNEELVEQSEDVTITNSTTMQDSDIVIPVVAGGIYAYRLFISYSAVSESGADGTALVGNWSVPSGTAVNRFTTSFPRSPTSGGAEVLNTGFDVIMRRPATGTLQICGGTDDTSPPNNFHSAYDRGTIAVGGTSGDVIWRFGADRAVPEDVILRGGPTQTRCLFSRIL
jgi:hypothetical protein